MKRKFLFLASIVLVFFSIDLNAQNLSYNNMNDRAGIEINFSMEKYTLEQFEYRGEQMVEVSMQGAMIPNDKGLPNLPTISRMIAIPNGANVIAKVIDFEVERVTDVNVAPAKEIQAIVEKPRMEYIKNEKVYQTDALYPSQIVNTSNKSKIRGVDAVMIGITPFQYNPVSGELLVYKNIKIQLEFTGGSKQIGDNKYRSPWFDPILNNVFFNYKDLPNVDYSNRELVGDGCEYLIVIPNNESFRPYAEQIKAFRTEQGILTKVVSLEEMGVTSISQMETYFHDAYNNWDIPPVAVLLMGDYNLDMTKGIPSKTTSHPYSQSCISDNFFADVNGDFLPEMVFARLVAENTDQLDIMVQKVIGYESNPCMEESFYHKPITALGWQTERWFQICSEVIGGYFRKQGKEPVRINAIYDGMQNTWSTADNTTTVVDYFGPNGLDYIPQHPNELGGWSGGTGQQIVAAINEGTFIVQHRDHGLEEGWGEPDFTNVNVAQLTNVGKLPFVFSINCLTGKFNNSSPCFTEAFIRHSYNQQPAGALGVVSPTEISYSFVNDCFVWGLYDLMDPNFMPDFGPFAPNSGNWMPAFGNVAGKLFLAQSNWPYNTEHKEITYKMFTTHADAFTKIYTEVPQELSVLHSNEFMAGNTNFNVDCPEGTLIGLTIDGELIASAVSSGGMQNIMLPATLLPGKTIKIVCTKQNYLRYESEILLVPADGPYVIGFSWTVNDESGDGILAYMEKANIDVNFKNIGVEDISNVTAVITTDNPNVNIIKGTAQIDNLNAGNNIIISDAFEIKMSENIENGENVKLKITCSSDGEDWISYITFKAFRPILEIQGFNWPGVFTGGEVMSVIVKCANIGGAPTSNVVGTITNLNSTGATILQPTANLDVLPSDSIVNLPFLISIDENINTDDQLNFKVDIEGDNGIVATSSEITLVNSCNLVFCLHDSYGDGWNGAKLKLNFDDGTPEYIINMTSGKLKYDTVRVHYGTQVNLSWTSGSWDGECSFEVYYEGMENEYIYTVSHPNAGHLTTIDVNCNFEDSECGSIANLHYEVQDFNVILSWAADEEITSFIILKDGDFYANSYQTSFVDELVAPGTYSYTVNGICNNGVVTNELVVDVTVDEEECKPIYNISIEVDHNNAIISWDAPPVIFLEITGYEIYRNGEFYVNIENDTAYIDSNLDNGRYTYDVKPIYSNECSVDTVSISCDIEVCYAPEEINISAQENKVFISWTMPNAALGSNIKYNVFRNDSIIANNILTAEYVDENAYNGILKYGVIAVYEVCGESEIAEGTIDYVGIESYESSNIDVYPNPSEGIFNIKAENEIYSISVINSIGQEVLYIDNVKMQQMSLDLSNFSSGMYTLLIQDQQKINKIKVLLKK